MYVHFGPGGWPLMDTLSVSASGSRKLLCGRESKKCHRVKVTVEPNPKPDAKTREFVRKWKELGPSVGRIG